MSYYKNQALFPAYRPRRLRSKSALRELVRETTLSPSDFIWPIFVMDGEDSTLPIPSMPGISRHTIDRLPGLAATAKSLGIQAICIFPYTEPSLKTEDCREAWAANNLTNRAIRSIKEAEPEVLVMTDIALDPYNINGHDGIVKDGQVINDETVEALVKMGAAQASAGADILGPSDMMDGRIGALRTMLEQNGSHNVCILSYSAKFSSSLYSPFRDAVGASNVLVGDKNTYQLDSANSDEAMRMIARDIAEGADMIMVKPGMPYLDICYRAKMQFSVPTFAYQVSGEYAMIQAASNQKYVDETKIMFESLLAFKRAGCDGILTYFAPKAAEILNS
jgi:porphobilinogen synthase